MKQELRKKKMKAFITGICGQAGSYLAELLLEKGYEVIGLYRRTSSPNFGRIEHIRWKLTLVEGELTDYISLFNIVNKYRPNEIYNLAAQSHVKTSFEQPLYTTQVDYLGCLHLLEVIRQVDPKIKFYQASTSELYGSSKGAVCPDGQNRQDENTPFLPNSPYAVAKLAAHQAVRLYRESYGIFACSGILFNHESTRRGDEFVTKKIINFVQKIHNLKFTGWPWYEGDKLKLGDITAMRDWGYAKDYVEGMYLMLQQDKPDDYVLATGETHTVQEFLEEAFNLVGEDWTKFVEISEDYKRPMEVPYLCGNYSKAKQILGWSPKIKFKQLVKVMFDGS